MGTKVEVTNKGHGTEIAFPKLMISGRAIVWMFNRSGEGVALQHDAWSKGTYMPNWNMHQFTDFHGTVTLSNTEN